MPDFYDPTPYRLQPTDTERLSDIMKVSPLLSPVTVNDVTSAPSAMTDTIFSSHLTSLGFLARTLVR